MATKKPKKKRLIVKKQKYNNLLFDATNLLYRTFYVHKDEDEKTLIGLAVNAALVTMNKYYKMFSPDRVYMCFDGISWRKQYTASDQCISKRPYKGTRRQNMTTKEKAKYEVFLQHIDRFRDMLREYSSIHVLHHQDLEADDLIAAIIQVNQARNPDYSHVIVSADGDMIQLLQYPNTLVVDPASGYGRTLEEWDNDPGLFIFEKCVRGDVSDNVQSAFPRVRKTRIRKAYKDPFERTNMMNEKWIDPDGETFKVGDLFKENQLLMDLTFQPENIQKAMIETILAGERNRGTYSNFHFLKFLSDFGLKRVSEFSERYIGMLSK